MSLTLIQNQSQVSVGKVTYTFTIPATGLYTVNFEATEVPPSGLVVVVKQGSTTKYTAPTIGETQSRMNFRFTFLYTAADVVTVVMTSSSANDSLINGVKSICSISEGEN